MIEALSHVHADVFGFVSFHPASVLSSSLRSERRTQWEPQAFSFKSTFLDEIRLHSIACSTQCLLQLSVALPCLIIVEITSCRSLLRRGGEQLVIGLTLTRHLFFLNGPSGITSASSQVQLVPNF